MIDRQGLSSLASGAFFDPRLGRLCIKLLLTGRRIYTISQRSSWPSSRNWTNRPLLQSIPLAQIQLSLWNAWLTCKSRNDVELLLSAVSFVFIRYIANRQPGKALPFYLRLRRPTVFDLIRDNNLFTDVQDQALLLVEFDHELMNKRKEEGIEVDNERSDAITLLVDHIHSIRVSSSSPSRSHHIL